MLKPFFAVIEEQVEVYVEVDVEVGRAKLE
jgi:hypothetical protein